MMKKALKYLFNALGLEVTYSKPAQSVRTNRLTLHKTKTGNYFLPTDAKADLVANTIISNNVFEPEVLEIAKTYVKPTTTVLDVGANFGQMSVLFSEMTGQNGKVYSFEADDFIMEILKKNIAANKKENIIEPIYGAVHNRSGETLYFPQQDFKKYNTYGSYGINYNENKGREIKTVTIDSIDFSLPVSFMKVDIQGGDLYAMQGAVETIRKYRMPILFEYEYHFQDEFNYRFQDYVDFVLSINYKFDKVLNGHNFLILPR